MANTPRTATRRSTRTSAATTPSKQQQQQQQAVSPEVSSSETPSRITRSATKALASSATKSKTPSKKETATAVSLKRQKARTPDVRNRNAKRICTVADVSDSENDEPEVSSDSEEDDEEGDEDQRSGDDAEHENSDGDQMKEDVEEHSDNNSKENQTPSKKPASTPSKTKPVSSAKTLNSDNNKSGFVVELGESPATETKKRKSRTAEAREDFFHRKISASKPGRGRTISRKAQTSNNTLAAFPTMTKAEYTNIITQLPI
ncbi:hypothetical protein HDU76_003194, partial [Blyttiomyces sp. JEL0837]